MAKIGFLGSFQQTTNQNQPVTRIMGKKRTRRERSTLALAKQAHAPCRLRIWLSFWLPQKLPNSHAIYGKRITKLRAITPLTVFWLPLQCSDTSCRVDASRLPFIALATPQTPLKRLGDARPSCPSSKLLVVSAKPSLSWDRFKGKPDSTIH